MKFCHWFFKILKNQNVVGRRTDNVKIVYPPAPPPHTHTQTQFAGGGIKCQPTLLGDISKGLFDLIFANPESLLGHYRSAVTELSKNKALKAIFVDEAHCIKKL